MALLVPHDLDWSSVPCESERRTIRALLDGLGNDWIVMPGVPVLVDNRDCEVDVVLLSRTRGVHLLEVKGGLVSLREGMWYQYDRRMKHSPVEQVVKAKHSLVKRMRSSGVDLTDLWMNHVIVMPDVGDVPVEGLGPDAPRENLWSRIELASPAQALLKVGRETAPVPKDRILKFVRALKPTVDLSLVDGQFHQGATNRLDEATRQHLSALTGLADNSRFLVTGAAGTGKTHLAEQWARQTVSRGEKTLFVCFNVPLADELAARMEESDVVVRSFHRFAREILTPFGFQVPQNADSEWWESEPARMIIEKADQIGEKFDSIVVDEGQDFRPEWISALEALHCKDGPRRLLMVADPLQNIYGEEWTPPVGMPSLPLKINLRCSRAVSRRVKELGGAEVNAVAPEGPPVRMLASTPVELHSVVSIEIRRLRDEFELPLSHIAVLTRHREERDHLINSDGDFRFVDWPNRDETNVLCSTIHRAKGLERVAVILVDLDEEPDGDLEYVGSSRSSLHLTVIRRAGVQQDR